MRLYDTRTRTTHELVPRDGDCVTMYTCGPTVQGLPHFGHARAAIVPDVLRRHLLWRGYGVLAVKNVTDVDDKIIAQAAEPRWADTTEVAAYYGRVFDHEMTRLNVLPPRIEPRATGHIIEMIQLIERLIDNGSAYEAGGDVLFRVRAFHGYGSLSGRDVDDLRAGERVEVGEHKDDPLDFALWKAAKPDEPSWASPWGPGRPGWHIECSAMAAKYLGIGFDIHTGGADLIFPHHENEIAQSEAATGEPFARFWVHNGLLNIDGEKMSKSLGNVIGLAETIDIYGADVVRLFFLAAHYRSPMSIDPDRLTEAAAAAERLTGLVRAVRSGDAAAAGIGAEEAAAARAAFGDAMDDDLATPRALAACYELVTKGHAHLAAGRQDDAAAIRTTLVELTEVLGLRVDARAGDGGTKLVDGLVTELLAQRQAARERRDFAAADAIRDRLASLGVVLEDTADGTRWHLAGPVSAG